MASVLILYSMLYRPSDQMTLLEGCLTPDSKVASESKKITKKLASCNLSADERKEIQSKRGKWYSECDANNIYYSILVADNYPARLAYLFIKEVKKELTQIDNYMEASSSSIQDKMADKFNDLIEKFNDPAKFDQLSRAT